MLYKKVMILSAMFSLTNSMSADVGEVLAQGGKDAEKTVGRTAYFAGQLVGGLLRHNTETFNFTKAGYGQSIKSALLESTMPQILEAFAKSAVRRAVKGSKATPKATTNSAILWFAAKLAAMAPKAFCNYQKYDRKKGVSKDFVSSWKCANDNIQGVTRIAPLYVLINALQDSRVRAFLLKFSDEEIKSLFDKVVTLFDDEDLTIALAHDRSLAVHIIVCGAIADVIAKKTVKHVKLYSSTVANDPILFVDLIKAFLAPVFVTISMNPRAKVVGVTNLFTMSEEEIQLANVKNSHEPTAP